LLLIATNEAPHPHAAVLKHHGVLLSGAAAVGNDVTGFDHDANEAFARELERVRQQIHEELRVRTRKAIIL
jgi:hypothetical protein